MFDFVEANKRVVQVILFLIIITFGFFGVDSYRRSGGSDASAIVDGEKISQQEFANAMRIQQERVREQAGSNFDPALFDKPEIKGMILDSLINQKLLSIQARKHGLVIGEDHLVKMIAGIDAFQKDGKFDKQRYIEVLKLQGLTPEGFQFRVQDELATRNLMEAYLGNGFASQTSVDNLIRLNEQQRIVSVASLSPESFTGQVKVDDAAIKDYYEKNQSEFRNPERAKVEYLVLSVDALLAKTTVEEEEIKNYYREHISEFSTPELRKAAHILISLDPKASEDDKKAARDKADMVLKQVKENPAQFAELAKKYSQDPGSAANGGDLGLFGRGMMVKSFDDAVFGMLVGEVSGLVQSDFGYHIIKLLAVKGGKAQSLAEVKSAIAQKIKSRKANDKYAELAEKFSETVFEQSDSLKPASDLIKLPIQNVAWLSKGQIGVSPWTDKALQAVFSDEVVRNKRNTAAIEIAPNSLLSARIVEYKPEAISPLDDVASGIRQKLIRMQASELAIREGKSVLEKLQHGEVVHVEWKKPITITRSQHASLDNEFTRQIFKAGAVSTPVYLGVESVQGTYQLARIDGVREVDAVDERKRAAYMHQLKRFTGEELLQAYLADVRARASIKLSELTETPKLN